MIKHEDSNMNTGVVKYSVAPVEAEGGLLFVKAGAGRFDINDMYLTVGTNKTRMHVLLLFNLMM